MFHSELLRFFAYEHLPDRLQKISKPFHDIAYEISNVNDVLVIGSELEMALRKLLEAKDCAVRAYLVAPR